MEEQHQLEDKAAAAAGPPPGIDPETTEEKKNDASKPKETESKLQGQVGQVESKENAADSELQVEDEKAELLHIDQKQEQQAVPPANFMDHGLDDSESEWGLDEKNPYFETLQSSVLPTLTRALNRRLSRNPVREYQFYLDTIIYLSLDGGVYCPPPGLGSESSEAALATFNLAAIGTPVPMAADGDCLFRSLSGENLSSQDALEMRRNLTQFLRENMGNYIQLGRSEDEKNQISTSLNNELQRLQAGLAKNRHEQISSSTVTPPYYPDAQITAQLYSDCYNVEVFVATDARDSGFQSLYKPNFFNWIVGFRPLLHRRQTIGRRIVLRTVKVDADGRRHSEHCCALREHEWSKHLVQSMKLLLRNRIFGANGLTSLVMDMVYAARNAVSLIMYNIGHEANGGLIVSCGQRTTLTLNGRESLSRSIILVGVLVQLISIEESANPYSFAILGWDNNRVSIVADQSFENCLSFTAGQPVDVPFDPEVVDDAVNIFSTSLQCVEWMITQVAIDDLEFQETPAPGRKDSNVIVIEPQDDSTQSGELQPIDVDEDFPSKQNVNQRNRRKSIETTSKKRAIQTSDVTPGRKYSLRSRDSGGRVNPRHSTQDTPKTTASKSDSASKKTTPATSRATFGGKRAEAAFRKCYEAELKQYVPRHIPEGAASKKAWIMQHVWKKLDERTHQIFHNLAMPADIKKVDQWKLTPVKKKQLISSGQIPPWKEIAAQIEPESEEQMSFTDQEYDERGSGFFVVSPSPTPIQTPNRRASFNSFSTDRSSAINTSSGGSGPGAAAGAQPSAIIQQQQQQGALIAELQQQMANLAQTVNNALSVQQFGGSASAGSPLVTPAIDTHQSTKAKRKSRFKWNPLQMKRLKTDRYGTPPSTVTPASTVPGPIPATFQIDRPQPASIVPTVTPATLSPVPHDTRYAGWLLPQNYLVHQMERLNDRWVQTTRRHHDDLRQKANEYEYLSEAMNIRMLMR